MHEFMDRTINSPLKSMRSTAQNLSSSANTSGRKRNPDYDDENGGEFQPIPDAPASDTDTDGAFNGEVFDNSRSAAGNEVSNTDDYDLAKKTFKNTNIVPPSKRIPHR